MRYCEECSVALRGEQTAVWVDPIQAIETNEPISYIAWWWSSFYWIWWADSLTNRAVPNSSIKMLFASPGTRNLILMIGKQILLIYIRIGCFLQWILKGHPRRCLFFILRSLSILWRRVIVPVSFISVKLSEIPVVEFLKSGEFEIWVESIYLLFIESSDLLI